MALGKIKADTLEHSTAGSLDTQYVVNGSAKVWCALNGQNTIAIRDSFNTASISDIGTGAHQLNYTSIMSNADYSATVSHQESQVNNSYGSPATGSIRSLSRKDGGTYHDVAHKSVTVHGDLA